MAYFKSIFGVPRILKLTQTGHPQSENQNELGMIPLRNRNVWYLYLPVYRNVVAVQNEQLFQKICFHLHGRPPKLNFNSQSHLWRGT